MPNLIPHCAARVDSLASATLLVAAALRLWNAARFQVRVLQALAP